MVGFRSLPAAAPLNQMGRFVLLFKLRLLRWGCVGAFRNAKSGTVKTARRDTKIAAETDFTAVERTSEAVRESFLILPAPIA
jgi:hypothetical protein